MSKLKVKAERKFETGPVDVSSSPPVEKAVSGLKFIASTLVSFHTRDEQKVTVMVSSENMGS